MENKNDKFKDKPNTKDLYFKRSVASATDCTGLIPTPPLTDGQTDSYDELFDIYEPKSKSIAEEKGTNTDVHQAALKRDDGDFYD